MLGFVLFALIYAAMGSFVSRPDDLQTLSLPLSLVAMVGYLTAIMALGGGGGAWVTLASFLPPFSPFVMLARLMVSAVQPWEVLLSIGLLVAAIAVVAVVATRMYAAGVLLYGPAARGPGVRRGGAAGLSCGRSGRRRRRPRPPATDAPPDVDRSDIPPESYLPVEQVRQARIRTVVATSVTLETSAMDLTIVSCGVSAASIPMAVTRTDATVGHGHTSRCGAAAQSSSRGNRLIRARTGAAAGPGTSSAASGGAAARRHRPRRHEPPQPTADPRQVGARALAGQDPGDPLGDGRLEQRDPLGGDGRHGHHLVARPEDAAQRLAPSNERLRQHRPAVEVQQVEGQERRRPPRLAGQPPRQLRRIRPPGGIDDDQLPVEDRRARRDADRQPGQLRQDRGDVPPGRIADDRRRRSRRMSAGPTATIARSPPHHGSNRCSSESNGAGRGRGSIGRRSGRSGSWSASRRSESWSAIVARW